MSNLRLKAKMLKRQGKLTEDALFDLLNEADEKITRMDLLLSEYFDLLSDENKRKAAKEMFE